MKEEDEYIDSIISSAINSIDVDVSMLNSDWNDLKPLLKRRRRKGFFIFLLLVSPFIAYGAYSILDLGERGNVRLEVENTEKKSTLVEDAGFKVKNEGIRLRGEKGAGVFEHKNNEDYEKQPLVNSSSTSNVGRESKTIKKRNAVGEKEKTTKSSSHLILPEPLEAELELRSKVLDSKSFFAKRPLVPLKQKIDSFVDVEYPTQDSVTLISKNKAYRRAIGIMYAKDLITFSIEDKKIGYKVGANFSIVIKKRLELIAEANYTQIGFKVKNDTVIPTPPPSGGYNNITSNSPSIGIASGDETVPFDVDYKANYIDFNLGLNWTFFQNKNFGMYINFSPEINYLVKEYKLIGYSSKISSSLNAGFGAQYLLGSKIRLFIQPNINYMYLGFKPIENSTIKSYSLEGKTGLKINF